MLITDLAIFSTPQFAYKGPVGKRSFIDGYDLMQEQVQKEVSNVS